MSIVNSFLFLFCVFFAVLAWRTATYYFEIEDNKMGWTSIGLSALNAASAASMIF
jgi:hypothetical protein